MHAKLATRGFVSFIIRRSTFPVAAGFCRFGRDNLLFSCALWLNIHNIKGIKNDDGYLNSVGYDYLIWTIIL